MSAYARMVGVLGLGQVVVARHKAVDVFDFEGRVFKAGFTDLCDRKGVVVGVRIAKITTHEDRQHVLGSTEIDFVRGQQA